MKHFSSLVQNLVGDRPWGIISDRQITIDQTEVAVLVTCRETLELFDDRLKLHSTNVSTYALRLAQALGLGHEERQNIAISGLVHDIGKLSISKDLLNKTGKLKGSEYDLVKTHSTRGASLNERILATNADIVEIVRHHHERYDGNGYPDRLAEEEIPVGARIIGVVDAYDAMTSTRTYRPKLSTAAALEEIERNCGTQFDPDIARVFIREVLHFHRG
ncbi:MAG TPA: HD-GYP domain-containing protein [Clostridia bacterium]|nr:HD-GYP domain-containing protein [Clostridia bacterium]